MNIDKYVENHGIDKDNFEQKYTFRRIKGKIKKRCPFK